jgi:hypothetical protein
MQSAVGASYVIFLTDCVASFQLSEFTHTKTCWRNTMIVTLWIFKEYGRLADSLGDWAHPTQLNDSSQWRGPAIMSAKGPTYQSGAGTSAVTASSVSYLTYRTNTLLLLLEAYEHHSSHPWFCSVKRPGTVKCVDCSVGKEGGSIVYVLLSTELRCSKVHVYWIERIITVTAAYNISCTKN